MLFRSLNTAKAVDASSPQSTSPAASEGGNERHAALVFAVTFLYVGILLFYIGLDIANYYNQRHLRVSPVVKGAFIAVTLAGYLVSLTSHEFALLTLVAALVTVINAGMLVRFLIKQNQ